VEFHVLGTLKYVSYRINYAKPLIHTPSYNE
jgi:hypothetical protein